MRAAAICRSTRSFFARPSALCSQNNDRLRQTPALAATCGRVSRRRFARGVCLFVCSKALHTVAVLTPLFGLNLATALYSSETDLHDALNMIVNGGEVRRGDARANRKAPLALRSSRRVCCAQSSSASQIALYTAPLHKTFDQSRGDASTHDGKTCARAQNSAAACFLDCAQRALQKPKRRARASSRLCTIHTNYEH